MHLLFGPILRINIQYGATRFFGYFGGEKNAIVPDGVIGIGVRAFEGLSRLTSVTIPDSVTSIGSYAFLGCNSLTIHASAGSCAEKYAKVNNIPFVAE